MSSDGADSICSSVCLKPLELTLARLFATLSAWLWAASAPLAAAYRPRTKTKTSARAGYFLRNRQSVGFRRGPTSCKGVRPRLSRSSVIQGKSLAERSQADDYQVMQTAAMHFEELLGEFRA